MTPDHRTMNTPLPEPGSASDSTDFTLHPGAARLQAFYPCRTGFCEPNGDGPVKNCPVENIRNFVLTGHAGAGKTTLADLMLFKAGVVTRLGSVDQKTSVSDFRPEEQERKCSLYTAVLNCPWKNHHFFFVDTLF